MHSPCLRFVDSFFLSQDRMYSALIFRCEFETIIDGLSNALNFSRTIGADAGVANAYEHGGGRRMLGEVDFH